MHCPNCKYKVPLSSRTELLVDDEFSCPNCNELVESKVKSNFLLSAVLTIPIIIILFKFNIFPNINGVLLAVALSLFSHFVVLPAISVFMPLVKAQEKQMVGKFVFVYQRYGIKGVRNQKSNQRGQIKGVRVIDFESKGSNQESKGSEIKGVIVIDFGSMQDQWGQSH